MIEEGEFFWVGNIRSVHTERMKERGEAKLTGMTPSFRRRRRAETTQRQNVPTQLAHGG